jgi:Flp pilus assembly protein CpaB
MPQAAEMRILAKNVAADQPILKDDLLDQAIPAAINLRLSPHMRAVNVSMPKERAAGGLIQLGEHVDVYLTTSICLDSACKTQSTRTAMIARDLRVIVKRNNLWTVMAVVPDDQPVHFTLEANPYRAALIEFSRQKGQLTLIPTPSPQEKPGTRSKSEGAVSFSDPDSREYRDEDARVASFNAGELIVGEKDLERIFGVKPLPTPPPPVSVEQYSGVAFRGTKVFAGTNGSGRVVPAAGEDTTSGPDSTTGSFAIPPEGGAAATGAPDSRFQSTEAASKECKTCGKKK